MLNNKGMGKESTVYTQYEKQVRLFPGNGSNLGMMKAVKEVLWMNTMFPHLRFLDFIEIHEMVHVYMT